MTQIFCVQDRSGTAAQITLDTHPALLIAVGDTGVYAGVNETDDVGQGVTDTAVSLGFTVGQILDASNFGIMTKAAMQSGWPPNGTITWKTGANANTTSAVFEMVPANAYIDLDFFFTYLESRGKDLSVSYTTEEIQGAIVQATDYLDQKYRFRGIKLLQFLANPTFDPMMPFVDPWLSPFGFAQTNYFTPSTTQQHTEWPRQGVVDFSGDSVFGVPKQVKYATVELAIRVLAGTVLQPDYDPNVAAGGGVVQSRTEDVGPIRTSTTYDTKFGLSFFPDFPIVRRMLSSAGLLVASGGRTIIR